MRRRLAGNSYGDVVRKLDALVAEFYPMTSARPQLCDRSVLDDLLVCNLVQPPLEPVCGRGNKRLALCNEMHDIA
jgi:hypothetical protein